MTKMTYTGVEGRTFSDILKLDFRITLSDSGKLMTIFHGGAQFSSQLALGSPIVEDGQVRDFTLQRYTLNHFDPSGSPYPVHEIVRVDGIDGPTAVELGYSMDGIRDFGDASKFGAVLSEGGAFSVDAFGAVRGLVTLQFGIDTVDVPVSVVGSTHADALYLGDGRDIVKGGTGNDTIHGGTGTSDLRDVIYGGQGDDIIDGGYGNDELRGDAGDDTIAGGFGADLVVGGAGQDMLTGGAYGDTLFGGDGFDFINGGFGHDRLNGGAGGDRFFHLGDRGHGSDWVQDYDASEGDVLVFGGSATSHRDFGVNFAPTAGAGASDLGEAFVVHKSSGLLLWALVDGAGEDITIRWDGGQHTFDF